MSGEPDRHRRGRRSLLPRAQAAALRLFVYWHRSRLVRRLQAADVLNQGLLVAAVLLLCFFPFLLVIESLIGRNDASGFIRRFGLTGEAAHAVRAALTAPIAPSTAIGGLSWVFFVLFGIAAAGAIQGLYERVFEVKGHGFRDAPRRAVWLAAALGLTCVGAWTQPWLDRAGGTGLVAIAALPAATAFWWFSMWLLLGGKLGWRELLPSALATGICWLGMVIVFRLTLSTTIASDYRKYGPAGVVFAIMTLLIAIGVVIVLGALLGVIWRERKRLGAFRAASGVYPGARPRCPANELCRAAAWPAWGSGRGTELDTRVLVWFREIRGGSVIRISGCGRVVAPASSRETTPRPGAGARGGDQPQVTAGASTCPQHRIFGDQIEEGWAFLNLRDL